MKPSLLSVFTVIFLVSWIAFYKLVDFNLYRVMPNGNMVLKSEATTLDRVGWSGVLSFVVATLDTTVLCVYAWARRPRPLAGNKAHNESLSNQMAQTTGKPQYETENP